MKIVECKQMSPAWYAVKCGLPSASSYDKIVTSKGESSKSKTNYLYRLAGETVTGVRTETYQSSIMEAAIVMEAEAREMYELITGNEVYQVGFCMADNERTGASPDGLIREDGQLEIKCPLLHTHIDYLLKKKLPTAYIQQVQGQLFVTGREWCDFMSYYPGIKPLIIRVERDKAFILRLENELIKFYRELDLLIETIK